MSETSTELAVAGPDQMITKYRDSFTMVLPSHVKPDHWIRLSQGVLRRDKKLRDVATRNPGSFMAALLDCARLGLEPGDTYHLVPFGNEVQGIPDWTGLVELVYRAGAVASVKAEVVHANDVFRWVPGEMDRPIHEPDWFGDRGPLVGAYAYAVMKDGATSQVVVYSKKQIDEVKAVSRGSGSASSPWSKWYDRMALKTVVRRLAKLVPSSAEYREQVLRTEAAIERVESTTDLRLPEPEASLEEDVEPEPFIDDDEPIDAVIVDEDEPDDEPPAGDGATAAQVKAVNSLLRQAGHVGPARFDAIEDVLGVRVDSTNDLSKAQASTLIDALQPEGADA